MCSDSAGDVVDASLSEYFETSDLHLPVVFNFQDSSSLPLNTEISPSEDWHQRLQNELATVQSGVFLSDSPADFSQHQLGPPSFLPPWSRAKPCVQRAYRADGSRVRDGGGVGSPLLTDPHYMAENPAHQWPDVLAPVRNVLQLVVSKVPAIFSAVTACSTACSAMFRSAEGRRDVSAEEPHFSELQQQLASVVQQVGDLAVDQMQKVSPVLFPAWRNTDLFAIADGQPFRLKLISALASLCGDPDAHIPLQCETGVSLGDVQALSDCVHYPVKSDSVDFSAELVTWSRNYVSAEQQPTVVRELLAEDLNPANRYAKGPFTWLELLEFLGLPLDTPEPLPHCKYAQVADGIAVMRLGCIDESQYDDSGICILRKYRLVCDGTASGVNPRVLLPCVMETPGILDGEALFSVPCRDRKGVLTHLVGMKIDVKSAFKRLKLNPSEYAHAVFFFEGSWYVYIVLPFGMKASAFWWVRFYSIIHRLLKRLLQVFFNGSAMYIDDSLYVASESEFHLVFSLILVFLQVLGVPISWKKVFIGTLLDWVGFRIDFLRERVFLSTLRLAKLRAQMDDILDSPRVPLAYFRRLVFRMVWACQIFTMAKVFLHGFFAVLKSQLVSTGYIFRVKHLEHTFSLWEDLIAAAPLWDSPLLSARLQFPRAVTRTDAMASSDGIFIGGWSARTPEDLALGNFQWFMFRLDPAFFPSEKASPNHMISAAEAVGVALAIAAFGGVLVESDSMVTVLASVKWYSPSPNLALAMRMILKASCHWKFRPVVRHVPGKDNALADALSRMQVDAEAAAMLHDLPAALRVPLEVFTDILPDLTGYLSIP